MSPNGVEPQTVREAESTMIAELEERVVRPLRQLVHERALSRRSQPHISSADVLALAHRVRRFMTEVVNPTSQALYQQSRGTALDSQTLVRRRAAAMLHGPIQGHLIAIALRLRQVVDRGADHAQLRDAFEQALHELAAVIDEISVGVFTTSEASDLPRALEELAQSWDPAINVEVELSPTAAESAGDDEVLASQIVAVAVEALANAAKHGHAHNVQLDISRVDDTVMVVAIDDGTIPLARGQVGIGLRELREVSCSCSIDPVTGGGARLSVLLPIQRGARARG